MGVENREQLAERVQESGFVETEVPNLPLRLSSFIGRQREPAEVGRLLASSRLVTLTGPGGSGKTRLALMSAARASAAFADGLRFVELAPLSDPALIPQVIAQVLDVQEVENRPILTLLLNLPGCGRCSHRATTRLFIHRPTSPKTYVIISLKFGEKT